MHEQVQRQLDYLKCLVDGENKEKENCKKWNIPFYVWFKNNCPISGPLYDDFRFEPIEDNGDIRDKNYFGISCDDERNEYRYEMFTARNEYNTEFATDNKDELIQIINNFGTELCNNNRDDMLLCKF